MRGLISLASLVQGSSSATGGFLVAKLMAGASQGTAAVAALVSLMKMLASVSQGDGSVVVKLMRIPALADVLVVELEKSDSAVVIGDSESYVEFEP